MRSPSPAREARTPTATRSPEPGISTATAPTTHRARAGAARARLDGAVGEVLAGLVNFFNPDTVVVGGALTAAHHQPLAGVREAVYRRSHPLATHVLRIEPSRTGADAAVAGAAILAIEHALSPDRVDRVLAGASPR
ncbi:ROK family protein [Streptomyces sp. NPDC059893]|uniref:ROK family protein n=1 Tax=Streptomyces sp. NPDC059893 TaxID=3346990 RepID=UPI0036544784